MTETECLICFEKKKDTHLFKCHHCKYKNCIDCHKIYLLSSSLDQHCMNCRTIIPFLYFIELFSSKWIFGAYKISRYEVLLNKEKKLFPLTIDYISNKKKEALLIEKKKELEKQIIEINIQINELNIQNHSSKTKTQYTYACPIEKCKGFLNKDFLCGLCDQSICKRCYTEQKEEHICDPNLIETFNSIQKEARPCPTCGEFISKINGCDQMFCIQCGTAFSWITGIIEKGIIHNPHAYHYFENHPDYRDHYIQNQNNRCGPPNIRDMTTTRVKGLTTTDDYEYMKKVHRNIAEFRVYVRDRYLQTLQDHTDHNSDLRIRYIKNEITEKKFKENLHMRSKKRYFNNQLIEIYIHSSEWVECMLWNILNIVLSFTKLSNETMTENISIALSCIRDMQTETNNSITKIIKYFQYIDTDQYYIRDCFSIPIIILGPIIPRIRFGLGRNV